MGVCAWQASAEFALFARFRATGGTTHRQCFLLCDFHANTMHGSSPAGWSIVTIAQSSARRMIIVESVGPGAGLAAKPRTIFQQEKCYEKYQVCGESKPWWSRPCLCAAD